MVGRICCGWLSAILLLFAANGVMAAAVPGVERVHFRTFGPAQGLSQATARAMAQDRSGFIWIGTQDGLSRFDGYEFRVYKSDRDDPWSLSQNHVWSLAADADGSLWVGTQAGGLNHYDPVLDRFVSYRVDSSKSATIASNHVTALMIDRGNRLWVANPIGRMQWFDRAKSELVDTPIGTQPSLRMVRSMLQSDDGGVWLGARDGLWRVEADGSGLHEIRDNDNTSLDVHALAQTPDGNIWVGVADAGLYRLSEDGHIIQHYGESTTADAHSLPDRAVRALLADADGGLWIAGNSRGLARLDPTHREFTNYSHDPARPQTVAANRLSTLLRGRMGFLFVGTWANGFSVHDPRTESFTRIESIANDPRTLPSRLALTVWGDPDGTLWAGVLEGGGLVHLDLNQGVIARYTHDPKDPDSLSHDFVQFITRTRDGSLWVATMGGGLNRLRPGSTKFEHIRHDPLVATSLGEDSILYLYEDRAGTLWAGLLNEGLDELCAGCRTFVHHRHDPRAVDSPTSLGGDSVGHIVETPSGDFWLGLRAVGLDRFNRSTGTFEHFHYDRNDPTSVASDAISTLTVDSRGELWVGTQGGGISHLLPGSEMSPRFETFGTKQGLAADAIGAIMEDSQGHFWISTTTGISRFDRDRKSFVNFGAHDGTLALGYWINGATRLPDGLIVLSGLEGISVFDPLRIEVRQPPKPLATRLLLQNIPVNLHWRDPLSPLDVSLWLGGKIDLSHDQDNITVEFSAFDYSDPESIRYSYRLDGHDPDWIETGSSRRFATYTDLAAGNYRLLLRARREGSDWAVGEEQSVEINVAPSAWASPIAYVSYVLALALLLGLVAFQSRAALRRREAIQEAIRQSEERLKMSLWGSGGELWDLDLRTRIMVRDNMLMNLAVNVEAAGQSIDAYAPFIHKEDLPQFKAALASHFRGDTEVFETNYRALGVNHDWIWVISRGRLVERDLHGRGLRMAGTTHDISALKNAEDALRKLNEELEQRVERRTADLRSTNADLQQALDRLTLTQRQLLEAEKLASLGGLVAGIAHEINTPIGVSVTAASHLTDEARRISNLLGSGEMKRSDLERFAQSALESSQMILRNLQRADRLIRSFKQVAVDQSTQDRRIVELGACIEEILITLGPTLKKSSHRIALVCAEKVFCETAPGALYQIITNLVMNSLIHAFPNGHAGEIGIEVSRHDDTVVIDYHDDGVGMDEVACAHIFDPFFTTRRGSGGSGLGMHIVYNLVNQVLAGTILVDSAPGAGFRLSIRFKG